MLKITIGPARPRMNGNNSVRPPSQSKAMHNLARLASRHGPTVVLDSQGGAMVLGDTAGDVELF